MALRMERSVSNTKAIAEFLASHPLVKKLNYAGMPSHPGAAIHAAQATSGGAVLSFETGEGLAGYGVAAHCTMCNMHTVVYIGSLQLKLHLLLANADGDSWLLSVCVSCCRGYKSPSASQHLTATLVDY